MQPNRAAPARPNFGAFLAKTTPINKQLSDSTINNFGDTRQIDCDRVGYLAYVIVLVQAVVTSAAGTTGNWDANFFPWNIVSRLRLESNTGYIHYSTKGFENYLVQKWMRLGWDPGTRINPNAALSGTAGARNAFATVWNVTDSALVAPGDALAASKVYNISVPFIIPLVSHSDLRTGLLMIQNNATRASLFVTLGTAADLANVTAGSLALTSCTIRAMQKMYSIPSDPIAQPYAPGEGFRHRIISEQQQWTAAGDIDYRAPVNGIICRIAAQLRNISSSRPIPQPFFSTPNNPLTPNLGLCSVEFASSQRPESERFEHLLWNTRFNLGTDMPDGVILFDFATGSSLEAGIAIEGLYNTRKITEFKTTINTTITPAAGAFVDYMRQELQPAA
jgi:hypothetical protein